MNYTKIGEEKEQDGLQGKSLTKFAEITELNIDEFNKCLDEHKYQNKVNSIHTNLVKRLELMQHHHF